MPTIADQKRLPEPLDTRLRARRDAMVVKLQAEHERSGKILYDAEWMDAKDARKRHRWRLLKQFWQIVELSVVALLAAVFGFLCVIVLVNMANARLGPGAGDSGGPQTPAQSSSNTALIGGDSRSSN